MEKTANNKRWSEEKISSAVLILLVIISVTIFSMFFTIDYDTEWEENTEFIEPYFTDCLINYMYITIGLGCLAVIASAVWFSRCHGHSINVSGGIPSGKIAIICIAVTLLTIIISLVTASNETILINGRSYDNTTWLTISDMLIHTAEVMFILAVAAVIYGMSGLNRRIQKF